MFFNIKENGKEKEVGQHCALCVEDNAPSLFKKVAARRTRTDHAWCYVRSLQPVEETSAPLNFFLSSSFYASSSRCSSSWYCCCCCRTHAGPLGTGYLQKVSSIIKKNLVCTAENIVKVNGKFLLIRRNYVVK